MPKIMAVRAEQAVNGADAKIGRGRERRVKLSKGITLTAGAHPDRKHKPDDATDSASIMLSVSVWREDARPAPSASRTAISFCRAEARAQEEVRDIRARDEQHQSHHRHGTNSGVRLPLRERSDRPLAAACSVKFLGAKAILEGLRRRRERGTSSSSQSLICW